MQPWEAAAPQYDGWHGGDARARAAAVAIGELLDVPDPLVLDLAVGPGSIARYLPGWVVGLDLAPLHARAATAHLPGRVVVADAEAGLPLASGSVDVVVSVWWLHLVADSAAVVAEIARVLRPGGLFVTTVDKQAVDELAGLRQDGVPERRGDATAALVAATTVPACGSAPLRPSRAFTEP